MSYVDGFVLPLPKKSIAAYKKMASTAAKVWKDHGALEYRECVGEDLKANEWCMPFPKQLKIKAGETVVFAWITYKSRKHRDAVNKKVMADKRLQCDPKKMPFDVKRMCYGGFETIVSA